VFIIIHIFFAMRAVLKSGEYLTVIGRGREKYRNLSVASRSRYFAATEFNNCFIFRSLSLFSYFNYYLAAQGSDQPFFSRERGSYYA